VQSSDDKLLKNLNFLREVKKNALGNKDVVIVEDLYQTQMFTLGVVQTLLARGYKIEKDDK
jgi:hypothetical protein